MKKILYLFLFALPVSPVMAQCDSLNPSACVCPGGGTVCDLLPDMTSSYLDIFQNHTEYAGYLTMSNATPNIGFGPMEIHGSNNCFCDTVPVSCSVTLCPSGNPPTNQLIQTIYQRNNNVMTKYNYLTPGTMAYHPSHGHLHIDNWAWYSLRKQTSNPDATTWPIVSEGNKQSFCLINLGDCDFNFGYCVDTLGNNLNSSNLPNYGFGYITGCGPDQGIFAGMLDIYDEYLNDPIPLTNVCNGNYFIVSITDPDNNFLEQNDNNNWTAVPITLNLQSPNTGTAPTFMYSVNGLTVSFTNTSGPTDFIWDFGDGVTDTLNMNPVHTYAVPGNYNVTLMFRDGCWKSTVINNILTGVEEPYIDPVSVFSAFPNPTTGALTVNYELNANHDVKLEVFDFVGKKVAVLLNGVESQGYHQLSVDLNTLGIPAGVYMLRLSAGGISSALRVNHLGK
jgi:hypothetical protein